MQCQLKNIHEFAEKNTWINNVFQSRVRILRSTKRNIKYLINKTISLFVPKINRSSVTDIKQHNILPGELVKIRSKEEIRDMLDNWEKYKGCLFIDEMYEYCGKTYKVLKEEQHFFDEVKQKMCKCKNIVILEGVLCSGRQRLFVESCDRACFFFWHKEWLKKI
ncbi:MAG: hypothetical protein A2W77_03960 [Nitrospinae bacterium RIFCSPLOWO2_12_39_16]|nr:MAG: hypothetical protein A2W77_03960 [Nitrospinae bacterium RIFCSPLOWO2_12_39_16]